MFTMPLKTVSLSEKNTKSLIINTLHLKQNFPIMENAFTATVSVTVQQENVKRSGLLTIRILKALHLKKSLWLLLMKQLQHILKSINGRSYEKKRVVFYNSNVLDLHHLSYRM